ncbi:hypothetical protein GCM10023191_009600 [Actinoallomurus oryzae]|uniref:RNA polymerase sigma-70 region 2 domain-containing protein n=1 Tax=Actinoallomurus oryzae TaxID=502180 RepID=A0ABP8PFD2_9ACTN
MIDQGAAVTKALDAGEFGRLTEPFRRELLAHCYRMLGSADEAEDLVQETYLRAWRSNGTFEGRSSLRVRLYRIATDACLTALRQRGRRALPSGLAGPAADPDAPPDPADPEVAWLQFPESSWWRGRQWFLLFRCHIEEPGLFGGKVTRTAA